jgi:hypothetical protein
VPSGQFERDTGGIQNFEKWVQGRHGTTRSAKNMHAWLTAEGALVV